MEITNVIFYPYDGKSNLKAFASVCFDDAIVVKNFKIVEGKKGLFVSFPSEKGSDGNYYDSVYTVTAESQEYVQDTIMEHYYSFREEEDKKNKRASYKRK